MSNDWNNPPWRQPTNHLRHNCTNVEARENHLREVAALWLNMVSEVYLVKLEKIKFDKEHAIFCWYHTTYSPLDYVMMIGDPSNVTNQIIRGQKAREKRWRKWVKQHEV